MKIFTPKLRNIGAVVGATAMMMIFCTGCDDDEPSYYNVLVGTWECIAPAYEPYNTFTFNIDGSGVWYGDGDYGTRNYPFTYETFGNTELYVYFTNTTWSYYYTVRGGSLYLYNMDNGGWNATPIVYN